MLARPDAGAFFRRLLIVAGVVLGAVVLWRTYEILLLVFAAALLATLLRALADFIGRARLPDALAYGLARRSSSARTRCAAGCSARSSTWRWSAC